MSVGTAVGLKSYDLVYRVMEYKKHFTDEELDGVLQWFETHWDDLPVSASLDKATVIKDFKHTVRLYFDIVNEHRNNPTNSGQIFQIFKMRDVAEQAMREKGVL